MKGLLLKDWYMITGYCRSYFLIAAVFAVCSAFNDENAFLMFYPCILFGMIPVTLLSYDERSGWTHYSAAMPFTKKQIVTSKYLIGLIMQTAAILLVSIIQGIKNGIAGNFTVGGFFSTMVLMLITAFLSVSLTLPLVFKFGVEKGRIAYYIVIGVLCFASGIFMGINSVVGTMDRGTSKILLPAGLLIATGLYVLSWHLSVKFYEKREL